MNNPVYVSGEYVGWSLCLAVGGDKWLTLCLVLCGNGGRNGKSLYACSLLNHCVHVLDTPDCQARTNREEAP